MNKNKRQLQQLIAYKGSIHLDMSGAMAARQEQLKQQEQMMQQQQQADIESERSRATSTNNTLKTSNGKSIRSFCYTSNLFN